MKESIKSLLVAFILFLSDTGMTCAQPPEKKICLAQELRAGLPEIDGKLDEASWKLAHWDNGFTQYKPYDGREASQQTYFSILYDNDNLYVGMKMTDTSPDSISQRLTRRDYVDGDLAGIGIDSYNDNRTAFTFSVSAAGVKYDYMVSNDMPKEDLTWDPVWWVGVTRDSFGWYAEMRIPLNQIRFQDTQDQEWGFQVFRYLFRNEETSLWQPFSPKQPGFVSLFGKIKGITNISPGKTEDMVPYVVAQTERFRKTPENPFRSNGFKNNLNAGLDAKIGLTNYLTMDITVNPDFGQVEADPSQVNLSTYETFLEEKRPFFIEGKNILDYRLNFGNGNLSEEKLFYSRRIGSSPHYYPVTDSGLYADVPEFTKILGAAKISGKTRNGWSVALLESMTAKENAFVKGMNSFEEVAVEPFTNYVGGRLQKDFNNGNTLLGGVITTVNRNLSEEQFDFIHKSALSAGMDFIHKWNGNKWQIETSIYGSRVSGSSRAITRTQEAWTHLFQRPDAAYLGYDSTRTSLTGHGGKILLGEYGGNWKFMGALAWKSPGLELNDLGYMLESNSLQQVFWTGYHIYEPFSLFNNLYVDLNQWAKWDFGGFLVSPGGNISVNTTFRNYWNFIFTAELCGETVSTTALRGGPALKLPGTSHIWAAITSNIQRKLTFSGGGNTGFSFPRSFEQSKGANLEFGYRPLKLLKFAFKTDYSITTSELQYLTKQKIIIENRYIFGTLKLSTLSASLRVSLNLTPDLSFQYWGQPFLASGQYSRFKRITGNLADKYTERFEEYKPSEIINIPSYNTILISEKGFAMISFSRPDFNVKEFLSNFVVRWEYLPGSTLYFVWSRNRRSDANDGSFELGRDIRRLFDAEAMNIFLLKLSYRLSFDIGIPSYRMKTPRYM